MPLRRPRFGTIPWRWRPSWARGPPGWSFAQASIYVLPYADPITLAKTVTTLDVLTEGRFRLGVGVGWMRAEFRRLGINFDERQTISLDYLRAMRQLWESDSPSYGGEYVSFDDVSFLPRPASQRIAVDFGWSGPDAFDQLAELGDGWYPLSVPAETIAIRLGEMRRLVSARGRDPDAIAVISRLTLDPGAETARMADHVVARGGLNTTDDRVMRSHGRSAIASSDAIARLSRAGVTETIVELIGRRRRSSLGRCDGSRAKLCPRFSRDAVRISGVDRGAQMRPRSRCGSQGSQRPPLPEATRSRTRADSAGRRCSPVTRPNRSDSRR
jgi:Luciferase-like monooxygenase